MFKELVIELNKAKTFTEIVDYKHHILEVYNTAYEKLCNQSCFIQNYEDITNLHNLNFPMMAYFGPSFYSRCGIPFLKEHNPTTLDIIELSILFYSLRICELIENGFLKDEEVNIIENSRHGLFYVLWYYFMEIITIKEDETRELTIENESGESTYYLTDENYEEVIDMIFHNYNDSKYSCIIDEILGVYRLRFTKMMYIMKYQPLFVEVGYRYLCSII